MYLVAIAWVYVVAMVALVEALSPAGSVLGALATLLLWGVLPLAIVLYVMNTPHRRRRRQRLEDRPGNASEGSGSADGPPDGGGHAAGDTVAPIREEP